MKESLIEQKFRTTFNSLGIGLALVSPEGNWIDVNPTLCKLVGYTASELKALNFQDITHPEDLPPDLRNLKKLLINQTDLYQTEKRYIHKSGQVIWVHLIVSVVRDTDKNALFFITQVQDITQRKHFENKLNEQNQHLTNLCLHLTQQNTKLNEFNQIVSHNLRVPVGNIQLLLNLYNQEKDSNKKNKLMQMLLNCSANLTALLNDLISMLKMKSLKDLTQERVVFQDILNKASCMLIAVIQDRHVQIENDFQVAEISYIRIYLESIIINLLSNAIKYSAVERTPTIKFRTFQEKGNLILEVSDNGVGIDLENYHDQIFKLNQTFHGHPEAKGLGLYMIKNHIESLGGNISVSSTVNIGSTFHIDFGKLQP
jgi:PAS domain S-box-containing protein